MLLIIIYGPLASGLGPFWVLFIIIVELLTVMIFVSFGGRDQQLPFCPGPWSRSLALETLSIMVFLVVWEHGPTISVLALGPGTLDYHSVVV